MQMRRVEQVLSPGMEHGEKTKPCPQMFGIGSDSQQVSEAARNRMPKFKQGLSELKATIDPRYSFGTESR